MLASGLWLLKSGLLHEGMSQALVVAVPIRCKHQQLVLRCGTVLRWSAGDRKRSGTKTILAPLVAWEPSQMYGSLVSSAGERVCVSMG